MTSRLRKILPVLLIVANTLPVFGQEPVVKVIPAGIIEDVAEEITTDTPKDETKKEDVKEEIEEEVKEEIKEEIKEEVIEDLKERKMIISLDTDIAFINDVKHKIEAKPFVKEGRTYLPLRFTGDKLLQANVVWNNTDKEATVSNRDKVVRVKMDSKIAYVDGEQVEVENEVITLKGRTYLPLRVMANLFDMQIDYSEATRSITMVSTSGSGRPERPKVKQPIAQFEFDKDTYTAGQTLKTIDKSFHEEGKNITNKEWMVDFDSKRKRKTLSEMFSKPNAGTYSISLRVEAGKGNWSEWETKEVTIHPNMPPEITYLESKEREYARGEEMDFSFDFNNEPWEGIKSERWTYRGKYEAANMAVVEKPKYIFHPGEYIVTLRLEDEFGNFSETKQTIVRINTEVKQNELEYRFTKGELGDTIDNFQSFNYRTFAPVEDVEVGFDGGNLLFSNSPERVGEKGILYRDRAGGLGRVAFHHLNGFTSEENTLENKRLVLIARNTSNEDVEFNLSNKVIKGPSSDILFVGQHLLYDYLKGAPSVSYTLKPGEEMYIHDSGKRAWRNGEIIAGKMDYDIKGELELTVAAVGADTQIGDIKYMQGLARDQHPRGTFDYSNIYYNAEPQAGEPSKIILGALTEEWMPGYDGLLNMQTENKGNFGINYKIRITAKENMGVILNPRAGTFRGALRWDYTEAFLAPNKGYIMGQNSKAINLGVIKAGETKVLEYTLPNGSASPVLLGFIPESHWDK